MTIKFFNTAIPYFDDWNNVKNKNYARILYTPGKAVQSRELTQMQTMIQDQIDQFGRHIFKEGTRVIGGATSFDKDVDYVKIDLTTPAITDATIISLIGTEILGGTSGAKGILVAYEPAAGTDPQTLFMKYTTTGTFTPTETLTTTTLGVTFTVSVNPVLPITPSIGKGSRFHVNDGVYYIASSFVHIPSQSITVDKYSGTPSARVVFVVDHIIVDSTTDPNLVDIATGSPNFAAPGAARYQIKLTLTVQDIDQTIRPNGENDIVQLGVIENGIVKEVITQTNYSLILDTLAQRTFEESGNYSVRPFPFSIRDDSSVVPDPTKYEIDIEPSVGYVQGFRISNRAPKKVTIDKARTTKTSTSVNFPSKIGNYLKLVTTSIIGLPDINTYGTINLYSSITAIVGNIIGSARVKLIKDNIADGTTHLFIFDVQMVAGNKIDSVLSVGSTLLSTFFATIDPTDKGIKDAVNNSSIYPLPFSTVNSILTLPVSPSTTPTDGKITYTVQKNISFNTLAGVTTHVVNALPNAIHFDIGRWEISANNGALTTPAVVLSSVNTVATLSGLTASTSYVMRYIMSVSGTKKTKTLSIPTVITGPVVAGELSLGHADIFTLTSVIDVATGIDITSNFDLDNGQRDNSYDVGKIILKNGITAPSGNVTATFNYFSHGAGGDYFSADSYINTITYDTIPSFKSIRGTYRLSDVIDFRSRKDDTTGNNFVGTGASTFTSPEEGTLFLTSAIEYYLPRKDKVYVTSDGGFGVVKGSPSLLPRVPPDIDNSMTLYIIDNPAYTIKNDDILVTAVDNKRYTMRDIGALAKRISNVERYTTLSLLETETENKSIFANGTTISKFKNGFVVDSFHSHSVEDNTNSDNKASMDKIEGVLRPQFQNESVKMLYTPAVLPAVDTVQKTGDMVTLPYTEVIADNQPYASGSVNLNPYYIFKYSGKLELSPASDQWKDITERPQVTIDLGTGIYDSIKILADKLGVGGTDWNSWNTDWVGVDINTEILKLGHVRGGGRQQNAVDSITTTKTSSQSRSGIRTSISSEVTQTQLGNKVVSIDYAPFIRSRLVYFKAQLLKPNTNVFLFFDGVDISSYARPGTFTQFSDIVTDENYKDETGYPASLGVTAQLVTDANGKVEGSFIVPNNSTNRFTTGSKIVKVTDSPTNDTTTETSFAEFTYEAKGLIQTIDGTVLSVKTPKYEVTEISENRIVKETKTKRHRWDPVAQSFVILQQGGIFATSIDIFFKTKDTTNILGGMPVTMQIRPVINGVPSKVVVPYSEVILYPDAINIPISPSTIPVATTFTFQSPIYLKDGEEYSIVLIAPNTKYEVFISELGQFDIANPTFRITDQPHLGSLFLSQNASTWSPAQLRDLKFVIKRAKFNTTTAGTVTLKNTILPSVTLRPNPFSVFLGSSIIRVAHRNHGMFDGSKVTISGVPVGGVLGIADTDINTQHTISGVELDSYNITMTGTPTPPTGTLTGIGGGIAVRATGNIPINSIQPHIEQLLIDTTNTTWGIKSVSGKSLAGNENPYVVDAADTPIAINETHEYDVPMVIPSADNEIASSRGLTITGTMTTINDNLSPVIDLERASCIAISNRINAPTGTVGITNKNIILSDPLAGNRYIDELSAKNGSAAARYITKKIELVNPATDLSIYVDIYKPLQGTVTLYYRIVPSGDDVDINTISWIELAPNTPIPTNEPFIYSEVEYTYEPLPANIINFQTFSIKLVMESYNSSQVPLIRNFRAIALT